MFHISTETFKAIYFAYFHSIIKCGRIWGAVRGVGGIHLAIKTYSVYKQKLFELWWVQSQQIHVQSVSNI